MTFGFFLIDMKYTSTGAGRMLVEVRPMDHAQQDAGISIALQVPIVRTAQNAGDLQLVVQHALEAAQRLLPESALQAWAEASLGQPIPQPCIPETAREEWHGRDYSQPTPPVEGG